MEVDNDEIELGKSICDLPEEILEIILMKVSPYNDLKSASLVCRSWQRLVQVVLRKLKQIYLQSVATSSLEWTSIRPEAGSKITERYSHCCCYYDKSLYVFGGCTASKTTLNDLWRFDLASREWIRPLAMGTYPSPKACASMVVYRDNLVLYGGWSHPTPFPLHQAARYFSELHVYKPATNRWSHLTTLSQQSPVAGHSASVVGDRMVVFGGAQVPGVRTNEVLYFDFIDESWKTPRVVGNPKPAPRYGHTQVTLDDHHVLILGGCVGPVFRVLNDCWLLTIGNTEWSWEEIKIENQENGGLQLWCHSACKVSNMIVALSRPARQPMKAANASNPKTSKPVTLNRVRVPLRENVQSKPAISANSGACNSVPENINQSGQVSHNAVLSSAKSEVLSVATENDQSECVKKSHDLDSSQSHLEEPIAGTSNPRPGLPSVRPNAMNNRQKQLEALLKYEKRFRQSEASEPSSLSQNRHNIRQPKSGTTNNYGSRMIPHVLDISEVLDCKTASWLKLDNENTYGAPDETTFFSLVEGRGEILMFGGIDKDIQSLQSNYDGSRSVNSTLHILKPIHNVL